jgi:CDP-diacylglycerol--glycerol-3-phosphate 3-phosphatidyltransferase
LLSPALVLVAVMLIAFGVYCVRRPNVANVKHNQLFGPFLAGFLVWFLRPIERVLVGHVSPNAITFASLVVCAVTGLAAAEGYLGDAVWLYALAGVLDVLDGRVARLAGKQSATGALLDSVSDRWGELFAFAGFAWYLHDSPWLLAVMGAVSGSTMVSYTRARAEGLGIALSGGLMQRAERMVLVASGTMIAAWYECGDPNGESPFIVPVLGGTMLLCGVLSTATAIHRWVVAHRELAARETATATAPAPAPARSTMRDRGTQGAAARTALIR